MRLFSGAFLVVLCALSLTSRASAQEDAAPAATAPAPWYSLFGDNRSDTFSNLRVQRLELSRNLNTLEAEVRDLRLKNEVLDDSIKQQRLFAQARSTLSSSAGISVDEFLDKRKRLEFDGKQRTDDINRDVASAQMRLSELEKLTLPSTSDQELIADLKRSIAEAPGIINRYAEETKFEIEQLDAQIERARTEQAQREAIKAEEEKARAALLAADEKAFADNSTAIVAKMGKIASLYSDIDAIDAKILKLIDVGDTDGWFKIIISLSFAALVAGVIYGFYRVINGNRNIVHAIFSNDSGIQFITIFSIIIAVILFGIIGVLEGKELSALLGGLSGYILGRNAAAPKVISDTPVGNSNGSGAEANPPAPAPAAT